ncbi:MAG: hypothetical protein ACR2PM_06045 [Hyphomicrobiales bacterium]
MPRAVTRHCLPVICIIAAALMLVLVAAQAQTQTETRQRTIYEADIAGRIDLDEEQRPLVEEILERSSEEQRGILIKHGIDPMAQPRAILLIKAAGELIALGQRTRRKLAGILDRKQLAEYDRIIKEVEARVRSAVTW